MNTPTVLTWDLECDGLDPSQIFVLGIEDWDTREFTAYTSEEDNITDGLLRLAEADLIIGHYVKGYDIPVIERLTNGLITFDRSKVVDTCEFSRELFPELDNHRLRTWGDILGYPKGEWSDFSQFAWPMVDYCKRDVEVTSLTARFFFEIMA